MANDGLAQYVQFTYPNGLDEDVVRLRQGFLANASPEDLANSFNNLGLDPNAAVDVSVGNYNPVGSMANTTNSSGGLFGLSNDTLAGIGLGLQGLSGLASAYLGYKNYQLAQDQFKFQKGLANRNLANQAKMINNTYDNAAQVAAGMVGSKDNNGRYGFTRQDVIDNYANNAKQKYVNGSPIG